MKIGGAVVVSNGDLFEFPKISYKNGNHLNELQIHCYRTYYRSFGVYSKWKVVILYLDCLVLQDAKSNIAVKNPLDKCHAKGHFQAN